MGRRAVHCVNPLNFAEHSKISTNNVTKRIIEACQIRNIDVNCVEGDRICYQCYWDLDKVIKRTAICYGNDGQLGKVSTGLELTVEGSESDASGVKRRNKLILNFL